MRSIIDRIVRQEELNFLLTNRIPRRPLTRFIGWFSRIEQPLVRDASLRIWRLFSELDLSDAAETRFRSLHDCFTRRLRNGARPVEPDPAILTSPCDGIVGAAGTIRDGQMLQVKGSAYALGDLLDDDAQAARLEGSRYVTLRLTAAMYHRFHAPHDCLVTSVAHIFGDVWNVNPATLHRVPRVFCRNERAVLTLSLPASGHSVLLVPVAAVLVAGIRLSFLDLPSGAARRAGSSRRCEVALGKGDEMGWFEHGSTIIVIAPPHSATCDGVGDGARVRVGQALMRLPPGQADLRRECPRSC